jgi:putative ABC transport system ATP-binding protein
MVGSEIPAGNDSSFVELRNVVKVYETPTGGFQALKGVSGLFGQGEFAGIIGKSGAGKSTLINMITGVDQLTSGCIQVGGTSVHELDENQMTLWRGKNVGIVYQSFELLPMLSLLENLRMSCCQWISVACISPAEVKSVRWPS